MNENFLIKALEQAKPQRKTEKGIALWYLQISEMEKALEEAKAEAKSFLVERKTEVFFPEDEKKVVYVEPKDRNAIEADKLGMYLASENRIQEFFKVANVTEKALRDNIGDAEVLIAKFKVKVGETEASVKAGKMSKKDLKEHAANGK